MAIELKNFQDLDFENVGEWPVFLRVAVIIGAFFLVLFLGYQFTISSKMEELTIARDMEPGLKSQYKGKVNQLMMVKHNEAQVEKMKKIFAEVLDDLPRDFRIATLLESISTVGKHAGLEFKLLRPSVEKRFEFYAVVPITIVVVGDYHQLAKFVSDVANLEHPLRFTNLAIIPDPSMKDNEKMSVADKQRHLELDLSAEVYRYIDSSEGKHV